MELKLIGKEPKVFPEQNLGDKVAYLANISDVTPADNGHTNIHIQTEGFFSVRPYSFEDMKEIAGKYNVTLMQDIIGKPVIAVYTTKDKIFTGIVPCPSNSRQF